MWSTLIDKIRAIRIQTPIILDRGNAQTFHVATRTSLLQHLVDRTKMLNYLDFISKILDKETLVMINLVLLKL